MKIQRGSTRYFSQLDWLLYWFFSLLTTVDVISAAFSEEETDDFGRDMRDSACFACASYYDAEQDSQGRGKRSPLSRTDDSLASQSPPSHQDGRSYLDRIIKSSVCARERLSARQQRSARWKNVKLIPKTVAWRGDALTDTVLSIANATALVITFFALLVDRPWKQMARRVRTGCPGNWWHDDSREKGRLLRIKFLLAGSFRFYKFQVWNRRDSRTFLRLLEHFVYSLQDRESIDRDWFCNLGTVKDCIIDETWYVCSCRFSGPDDARCWRMECLRN